MKASGHGAIALSVRASLLALAAFGVALPHVTQAAPVISKGVVTVQPTLDIPPAEKPIPVTGFRPQLVETSSLIRATQARAAHNVDGTGMTIAVLDTGIRPTHAAFAGRIVLSRNYTPNDGGDVNNVTDRNGHGTNVASLAMAHGTHTGIAPGANVAVFKVLQDVGSSDSSWGNNALQWLVDNAEANNISVVNMSLGNSVNATDDAGTDATRRSLISQLRAKKIAVVVSAGNNYGGLNTQGMNSPAIIRDTVSVGAVFDANIGGVNYSNASATTTAAGRITPFSQRLHPSVGTAACRTDIFAPGAALTGAGITDDTASSTMHGTSQAAPVLSGVVLLMQQKYKALHGTLPSVDLIETLLRTSAVTMNDGDDEDDSVPNTGLDFPRVDALNALDAIGSGDPFVSISNTSVNEAPEGATAQLTVSLSAPATSEVSVNWTTQDGTAIAGSDYVSAAGTLNFLVGQQTKTIDVTVNDDQFVEGTETFGVKLTSATGVGIVEGASTGTVTISDNDSISLVSPVAGTSYTGGIQPIYGTTTSTGVTAMKYYRRPMLGKLSDSAAIPQGSTLSSVQSFSSTAPISKFYLYLNFSHPSPAQLSISIRINTGGVGTIPNSSGIYTLNLPAGSTITGDWTLRIQDNVVDGSQGTLNSWAILAVPQSGDETLINTATSADANGRWNTNWDTAKTPNGFYVVTMRSFNGDTILGEDSNDLISVEKALSAPTDLSLSPATVAENQASGAAVGTLTTTDASPGDAFAYSLVAGDGDTNNASFSIVGDKLQTAASFNYEDKNSYTVRVRSTDVDGASYEKALTISVTDANDAPTDIALSNSSVAESEAIGTVVGSLSSTDADTSDTHTYTLVAGSGSADNDLFTIEGSTLKTAAVLRHRTQSRHSIRVQVTDAGGATFKKVFHITIVQENEAPGVSITAPTSKQKVFEKDLVAGSITGSATDNKGVASVMVQISRYRNGAYEYWNGTLWSDSKAFVAAVLADAGKASTTWSLQNVPGEGLLSYGNYAVVAYAVDLGGNKSVVARRDFVVVNSDMEAPVVTVATPTSRQHLPKAQFIAGTIGGQATDNKGVAQVLVQLLRYRNGSYQSWDGDAWSDTRGYLEAEVKEPGATSTGWRLQDVPGQALIDNGGYTLYVYAVDTAGRKSLQLRRDFSVLDSAPAQNQNSASNSASKAASPSAASS